MKKYLHKIIIFVAVLGILMSPITATVASANSHTPAPVGIECFSFRHGLSPGGCFALVGYGLFYVPASAVLLISGAIFDSMMAFTLSNELLNQPFVADTWEVIRDFANLMFIFILLYIAIATILRLADYKKLLANLIIIALLINFSAFFTKIVIDASNIFALQFYTAISAPVKTVAQTNTATLSIQEKQISAMFINAFDPQRLSSGDGFKKWTKGGGDIWPLFFMYLVAAVVIIIISYALLVASMLLLGRMVAFWFLIIVSPLAFAAWILPKTSHFTSKWWGHLINQALVAPVFLFFLYVIATILSSSFLDSIFPDTGTSITDMLINMVLAFSVVVIALFMAIKVTQGLSGTAGAMATGIVKKGALMAGGGLALKYGKRLGRGAAQGLRTRTIDKKMSDMANSGRLAKFTTNMPVIGGAAIAGLNKMGGAAYDKKMLAKEKQRKFIGDKVTQETQKQKGQRLDTTARQKETLRKSEVPESTIAKLKLETKAENRASTLTEAREKQYATNLTAQSGESHEAMNRSVAEEIGQLAARAFNDEVGMNVTQHEKDKDLAGKKQVVTIAKQDIDKLNIERGVAKASGLDTSKIDADINSARALLATAESILTPVEDTIKNMNSQKKKIRVGKGEKSLKDQVTEALQEQKAEEKKSGGDVVKEETT